MSRPRPIAWLKRKLSQRKKPLAQMPVQVVDLTANHGEHFISTPGILAQSHEQLGPLMPTLLKHELLISGIDYLGSRFNANSAVVALVAMVKANIEIGQKTILFGSSMGGMITAKALAQLREELGVETVNAYVRAIVVDAPANRGDLIMVPLLPAGFNRFLAALFRWLKPGEDANAGYGKRLLGTFRVPPKEEETELIEGGPSFEDIKKAAIAGLSGHMFTMWFEQVRWMLNTQLDLSKLEGLDVTYIACMRGNGTVRQPRALKQWGPHVRRTMRVNTPHCAYLQAADVWNRVLNRALLKL